MADINLERIPFSKTISALKHRRDHLKKRIEESDIDLSFDKRELMALHYCIALMYALRNCKWLCGTLEASRSKYFED